MIKIKMFRIVLFNESQDTIANNTMYLVGNYSPVLVFSASTCFYKVYCRVYKFYYSTGN